MAISEKKTGLGLLLPEVESTIDSWENLYFQNQHLLGIATEFSKLQSKLISGTLDGYTLRDVEVLFVLTDGSTELVRFFNTTITVISEQRQIVYANRLSGNIESMIVPTYEDFSINENYFPLVHCGTYADTDVTQTEFISWIANRHDPDIFKFKKHYTCVVGSAEEVIAGIAHCTINELPSLNANDSLMLLDGEHLPATNINIPSKIYQQSVDAVIDLQSTYELILSGNNRERTLSIRNATENSVEIPGVNSKTVIYGFNVHRRLVKWASESLGSGNEIELVGIYNTAFIPLNHLSQVDGTWTDGDIPGCFACTSSNKDIGCPDLTAKFAMGSTTAGSSGGKNSFALSIAQLPAHNHSINHNHGSQTLTSGNANKNHGHEFRWSKTISAEFPHHYVVISADHQGGPLDNYVDHSSVTGGYDHTHQTSVDISNFTGNSGNVGGGNTIENRPSFYSVIIVKKVI